ncbi:MAG: ABC transporter substrate-binding protein [Trueperaceae bacterium]|nr:ABC transporter substrate-binding protein [Trueperaceae bacterium]
MQRFRLVPALLALAAFVVPTSTAQAQDELVVSLSSDPTSLFMPRTSDRTASNAAWSLFDSLVWIDDDGNLVPALATDWTISDDGTEYVFELREGVTFHNGETFDAESVVATWETGQDESNDYASAFSAADLVEAIDPYTVRITTPEPNAIFLTTMANNWAMVPPAYIREVGLDAFAQDPVGTGPFRFVERTPGERIVMEANPNYWADGLPRVDRLVYRVIPDGSTRLAAIQTGDVDVANRLTPDQVTALEGSDDVEVVSYLNDRVYYVAFKNMGAGVGTPLEDRRVRQALNFGLDRFGINQAIFSGQANAAPGFVVEGNLGYDADAMQPFPYDPDRARELLAEAGYEDGFEITMGCPADGYVNINEVCQAIASSLGQIGVDVEVDFQTTNAYWSEPNYAVTGPMYVDSWSSEFGEAIPRLDGALTPGNYYNTWEDERIADLIQEIQREVDRDARAELYGEMHELMREDPPFIYLYQPVIFEAIDADLEGYQPRAAEEYYLRSVGFAD